MAEITSEAQTNWQGAANETWRSIKVVAAQLKRLTEHTKQRAAHGVPDEDTGEMVANLTLAYRHLEDASMRIGKALQAHDGGVSVYDRTTTVGA